MEEADIGEKCSGSRRPSGCKDQQVTFELDSEDLSNPVV